MATKMVHTKSHKHSLELKNFIKQYICDGCKEKGFGPRYRCEVCNFDLHEDCMKSTTQTSHEFFPKSIFKFHTTPPKACHEHCKRLCDACQKPINGFVYHCKKHDLDLHPCCRNLKMTYKIYGEEEEEALEFILHKKVQKRCLWCNKKRVNEGNHRNGWSYISKGNNYHVHVACITEMLLEELDKQPIKKIYYNVKEDNHKTLPLQKVNLKEIQAKRNGNDKRGSKCWKILKVFIKTIVSIVVGDPTMVLASSFLELCS